MDVMIDCPAVTVAVAREPVRARIGVGSGNACEAAAGTPVKRWSADRVTEPG
jgi:hypothetical protein